MAIAQNKPAQNKRAQANRVSWIDPLVLWSLAGLAAFALLPWTALEYGIFDVTGGELLAAYGWSSVNLSLVAVAVFALFMARPWRGLAAPAAHRVDALLAAGAFLGLLAAADGGRVALGYGAAVQLIALGGIAAVALARLGFIRGDAFMTASILIIVGLVILFVFFPISMVFSKVLVDLDGTFTPFAFFDNVTAFGIGRVLVNSLSLAVAVGVSTTILGLVFALYAARVSRRAQGLIKLFSILPIITPPFVIGLSLILIFGRNGTINDLLLALFGDGGLFIGQGNEGWFERSPYIYGFWGIFLAQTLSFTPISFMLLVGMISTTNPALEEASLTMRASDWQTFRHVTFPLIRPGIANAFLLGVIASLADFGNPLVLGGDYDVMATEIYFSIVGAQLDYARAATLGILLLAFSLAAYVIQRQWIGKKSYVTVTGKGGAGGFQPLPRWMRRATAAIAFAWILFTAILYGSILLGGFVVNWGADYTPTLAHYEELWTRGLGYGAWPSFLTTLGFAAVAAPLTAVLGILIAYVTTRRRFLGRNVIDFGAMICFAIPGTVIGVSYVIAFNTPPILLTGSAVIVIISFVFRNMPVGIRAGISALSQIDVSLEEASLTQRAGSMRTIFSVVLPLLRPALISAIVFSFVKSMTSVSAIIFLVTADTQVATTYILGRVEDGDYGQSICYGSVLIITMLAVILVINRVIGRSRTERQTAME
ncbi:MAG: iron ABC transporter permease [Rhodobacterales bacterium]|nr:iron ABC transporter permease [Rhodobacterales bacterium]